MVGGSPIVVAVGMVAAVVVVVVVAAGFLTSLFAQLKYSRIRGVECPQRPLGAEVAFQSTAIKNRKPGKRHYLSFVQIFSESLNEEQKQIYLWEPFLDSQL